MVDTRDERRVIGGPASEFEGTQWIRGFKEGETQLRILESASSWWRYREHYSPALGYFACNSAISGGKEPDPEDCIGCADPSERVRNRSLKFAFNAIDSEGHVKVFKLGSKLRKTLRQREQNLGRDILQKRDILIIRTGTGFGGENGTEYSYEWGQEYDLEESWPDESQLHSLGEVVTASYWDAVDKLQNGDVVGDEPEGEDVVDGHEEAEEAAPADKPAAKKTAPAKKAVAKKIAARKPEPDDSAAVTDVTPDEPGPDGAEGEALALTEDDVANLVDKLRGWDSDDIRSHLEKFEVEFPQRCPKPRLLAIAEQALIDGKLPPF